MEARCVLCEVRTEALYTTLLNFRIKHIITYQDTQACKTMPVILWGSGQWVCANKEVSVTTAVRMTATSTYKLKSGSNSESRVKVKLTGLNPTRYVRVFLSKIVIKTTPRRYNPTIPYFNNFLYFKYICIFLKIL